MAQIQCNFMTSLNMTQMTVSPPEYLFAPLPVPAFLTARWAHMATSGPWTVSGTGVSWFQAGVIQSLRSFPVYLISLLLSTWHPGAPNDTHYKMDEGHPAMLVFTVLSQ